VGVTLTGRARLCRPCPLAGPAHAAVTAGFSIQEREILRETDSPLEGTGFELPVPREIRFGFRGLVFALRFVAEGDRLYVEHYHGHTGQFIIGAVFKKGTGRDPDSVIEAQRRDLAPAELTTRAEPAVPGDHVVVAIDQDRDVEVESLDAIGDLPDLLLGVLTRVRRIRLRPRRSDDKQSLNLNWIASYVRAISNSYNAQLLHS
jgi:hypothetical protein